MKEIVVMSGKGGTGKTSITAALGVLAGERAVVGDCDVGAANLHILYEPTESSTNEFWSGKTAVIDYECCVDCGICLDGCRFGAISIKDDRFVVDEVGCEGCSVCKHMCPFGAISMIDNLAGNWFVSRSRFESWFVHAKLGIGQDNSGKLVAKVKDEARKLAEREKIPYGIIDGPPGVGCPAISAISGTSHVLIVTEATRSGLHDLKRMVDLAHVFRVQVSCVINKCNLDAEVCRDIQLFCDASRIDVLAYIPFDPVFTKALQAKKTLIETDNTEIIERIGKIWNQLQSRVTNVRRTV